MNKRDHGRIVDFYESAFLEYGNDSRSVHWSSEDTQRIRFEILSRIADLTNKRILDVGSGLGDLYAFFLRKEVEVLYTGIDIVPVFVERARVRFPDAKFILTNGESIEEDFDYIVASGSFNFTVENAKSYYFEMITSLFSHAKLGMAFNMLNCAHHESNDTYIAYDVDEVITFCKTLTPYVTVIDTYLPWDFTVYMYKQGD